jgi:hypothetical protein
MTLNKEQLTMLTRTFLIAALVSGGCFAQSESAKPGVGPAAEQKYFHLDFVVKEVEAGKTVNSRAYAMTILTGRDRSSIRSGAKVPLPGSAPPQYVDVGTNIDCSEARELQDELALTVTAEVSTTADSTGTPPFIRQVKWNSPVLVPLRKPTIIFSSDDPSSKRQMQLELTATPMK